MKEYEFYIETTFEPREGYTFPQPVERLKGKKYYEYEKDSFERKNWHIFSLESDHIDRVKKIMGYNDPMWTNEQIKKETYEEIYQFEKNKPIATGAITELLPIEIYIINKGYKIQYFGCLNAYDPRRTYYNKEEEKRILIGFEKIFYLQLNKEYNKPFHIEHEIDNFDKLIKREGKIKQPSMLYHQL